MRNLRFKIIETYIIKCSWSFIVSFDNVLYAPRIFTCSLKQIFQFQANFSCKILSFNFFSIDLKRNPLSEGKSTISSKIFMRFEAKFTIWTEIFNLKRIFRPYRSENLFPEAKFLFDLKQDKLSELNSTSIV